MRSKQHDPTTLKPSTAPFDWQQAVEDVARRLDLPIPSADGQGSVEQAEQRLKDFEQKGGE